MKVPLFLCVALASALAGCNDNCDLDYCGSTSQSIQSTYQAQASNPTYQAPSRQSSNQVVLSGYGGMYSGVTIPDDSQSSQRSQPSSESTYQASAPTSRSTNYIAPGIALGGCNNPDMDGEYHTKTNMIHLCKVINGAWRRYVIAHEEGHAIDWQKDGRFEPDLEYWADQYAINQLLQEGDCEAIAEKTRMQTDRPSAYTKGTYYAREMHSIHC